ncbi:MAG: response regulator [Myxococcota bacterium]
MAVTDSTSDFPILLVDDDDLDIKSFRWAFQNAGLDHPILAASDGASAMKYLRLAERHRGDGSSEHAPRPGLVLIDYRMPRLNGLDVLRLIRSDPVLDPIPVLIMTTCVNSQQTKDCYRAGAAGVLQKPSELEELENTARIIHAYWSLCALP